jgi:hypothetical protein
MRLYSTNFSTKQAAQNDCSFMERHSLQFHNIRTRIPEESQAKGFYSLLFLAQALGKQNTTDEFQITVISNNLQSVTGLESLCPEKATVLELLRLFRKNIQTLAVAVLMLHFHQKELGKNRILQTNC